MGAGPITSAARCSQRLVNSVPRQRASRLNRPSAEHQEADPDHRPERPEHHWRIGPVGGRHFLQPGHTAVPAMGQDQRGGVRDLDLIVGALLGHVRQAEQDQRGAVRAGGVEVAFHRGDLHRLVLERVEPVDVAHRDLQRRHDRGHPHRHGEHRAHRRRGTPAQQVIGADRRPR